MSLFPDESRTIIEALLPTKIIKKVIPTGKIIAPGKFSSIVELKIEGPKNNIVVGKVFKYSINPENVQMIAKKAAEISVLSHENIVETKGVCFLPDRIMPVLLMEKMTSSLQSHFQPIDPHPFTSTEENHHHPLTIEEKITILRDTASGLDYLHSCNPPFIHGHLTTENILLNDHLRAKIGGFVLETTLQLPQNMKYAPPEAQEGMAPSDPSFDVFSFGHLALVTIIGEEKPPLPIQCFDEQNEIIYRSEVERRSIIIKSVKKLLSEEYIFILNITEKCLCNNPKHRCSASQVLQELQNQSAFHILFIISISAANYLAYCYRSYKSKNP